MADLLAIASVRANSSTAVVSTVCICSLWLLCKAMFAHHAASIMGAELCMSGWLTHVIVVITQQEGGLQI